MTKSKAIMTSVIIIEKATKGLPELVKEVKDFKNVIFCVKRAGSNINSSL